MVVVVLLLLLGGFWGTNDCGPDWLGALLVLPFFASVEAARVGRPEKLRFVCAGTGIVGMITATSALLARPIWHPRYATSVKRASLAPPPSVSGPAPARALMSHYLW